MKFINVENAPQAIGAYSHAVQIQNLIFLSGQIGLKPDSMTMCSEDVRQQLYQIFANIKEVCKTAGGDLGNIVKLTVYLIDIASSPIVNEVMEEIFVNHFPARSMLEVSKLPKNAKVEIDAIMATNL